MLAYLNWYSAKMCELLWLCNWGQLCNLSMEMTESEIWELSSLFICHFCEKNHDDHMWHFGLVPWVWPPVWSYQNLHNGCKWYVLPAWHSMFRDKITIKIPIQLKTRLISHPYRQWDLYPFFDTSTVIHAVFLNNPSPLSLYLCVSFIALGWEERNNKTWAMR